MRMELGGAHIKTQIQGREHRRAPIKVPITVRLKKIKEGVIGLAIPKIFEKNNYIQKKSKLFKSLGDL